MKFLLLVLVSGMVMNWIQIWRLLSSLGKKEIVSEIQDPSLLKLIYEKSNLKIQAIKIVNSKRPFGMMVGFPIKLMILSRSLYETFNKDELEYVVLHEAGHSQLWHSITEILAFMVLAGVGLYLARDISNLYLVILMGLFIGILLIQFGRFNEYQADRYSLKRISNPRGMVTATEKFRKVYGDHSRIWRWLFFRGVPYEDRVKMAEAKLHRANQ